MDAIQRLMTLRHGDRYRRDQIDAMFPTADNQPPELRRVFFADFLAAGGIPNEGGKRSNSGVGDAGKPGARISAGIKLVGA